MQAARDVLTALLTGCGASSKNMAADTASPAAQNWKTESAAAAEEWGYDTPAEAPAETETAWQVRQEQRERQPKRKKRSYDMSL